MGGGEGCRRVLHSAAARLVCMRTGRKDERSILFFLSNVAHYSGGGKEVPASLYSQRRNFLHASQRTRRASAKDNSTFCVTTVDFHGQYDGERKGCRWFLFSDAVLLVSTPIDRNASV